MKGIWNIVKVYADMDPVMKNEGTAHLKIIFIRNSESLRANNMGSVPKFWSVSHVSAWLIDTKTAISKDTFGHSRESGNPEKTLDPGSIRLTHGGSSPEWQIGIRGRHTYDRISNCRFQYRFIPRVLKT